MICEKPAQARDIARNIGANTRRNGYLEGNGYQVTWCIGHLLQLAPPEHYYANIKPWRIEKLPIIPQTWKRVINPKTKSQFNIVRYLIAETNHIIIASDPDREGECIVRELLEECDYRGYVERLWLSALDDRSIQKALANLKPGSETESLYHSGVARARADYLIGINLTMAASSLYGVNSVLSIGRVQTPTLALVAKRDRDIDQFKPQNYFVLRVDFNTKSNEKLSTTWKAPKKSLDKQGHCLQQTIPSSITELIEGETGVIEQYTIQDKRQSPPPCLSLSDLQNKVSSKLGLSAKRVLEIVQSLYEQYKAVSYPRTDCGFLPEEQFHESPQVLSALGQIDTDLQDIIERCDSDFKSKVWNTKKITAHHAIIPTTNNQVDINKMSPDELSIYRIITNYYLAQFLGDYKYQQTNISIDCIGEQFVTSGKRPLELGWKTILTEPNQEELALPSLAQGQQLTVGKTKLLTKQTKPPEHYTEGMLIDAMKHVGNQVDESTMKQTLNASNGIGTEATRANILETLFKRKYLVHQKKTIRVTPKGFALIDLVPDSVKNPTLTAKWEQELDNIANGNGNTSQFISDQSTLLRKMLKELKQAQASKQRAILQLQSASDNGKVYLCPECQKPLRRLKNKRNNFFWGCSNYPSCSFTTWEKNRKPSINPT